MELDAAKVRALDLIAHYLDEDWHFRFDHARRRFGACDHAGQTISVSRHLTEMNGEEEFLDVVLHEIAHALAGRRAGHGPLWRDLAAGLGAHPTRCYDAGQVRQPTGYLGRCPSCDAVISRARRIRVACRSCCDRYNAGRFSAAFTFVWGTRPGVPPPPAPRPTIA